MRPQKMTPSMQAKVETLVNQICAVTEGKDEDAAVQALAFCLFAHVCYALKLNVREAVEYCAKHIEAWSVGDPHPDRGETSNLPAKTDLRTLATIAGSQQQAHCAWHLRELCRAPAS